MNGQRKIRINEKTTSGVKLIFRENSGKFIFNKLEFFQKIQKNIHSGH